MASLYMNYFIISCITLGIIMGMVEIVQTKIKIKIKK